MTKESSFKAWIDHMLAFWEQEDQETAKALQLQPGQEVIIEKGMYAHLKPTGRVFDVLTTGDIIVDLDGENKGKRGRYGFSQLIIIPQEEE